MKRIHQIYSLTITLIFLISFFAGCKKEKTATIPVVISLELSNITDTSAISGGNITNNGSSEITARGICWGLSANPSITDSRTSDGTGMGEFTSNITGLKAGTVYHLRAYATNSVGTAYGADISFSSKMTIPKVTSIIGSAINATTAASGGNITNDGGATVTSRGVCWNKSLNPTITDNKTIDGTGNGSFTSNITGLFPGTTYYLRAYATNSVGTAYGNSISFTTNDTVPTLNTTDVSSITITTAISGGDIANDGGAEVTSRGVCWSTSPKPTIANSKTTDGSGETGFTSNLTGLIANTTYYVRAYATNNVGTGYGNTIIIKTYAVADVDGNLYRSITIGTQVWMVENLKTTKYNDGTDIPNIIDNTAWTSLTTPAYCWYNNDISYKNTFGALYNWYAVNTSKLAPNGWHVPSDAEWTILDNYLIANGYNYDGTTTGNKYAKAIASASGWNSSTAMGVVGNTDYPENRNATGFTGLPSGWRYGNTDGTFGLMGMGGGLWSYSESDAHLAWSRAIYNYNTDFLRFLGYKTDGTSVRCVKD